jgi:dolichol-phosphate mannosyltransferase
LASFYAVCGIGAVANVGVAASIAGNHAWWLAGLAGAAVSVVWNYVMSSIFTWSTRRPVPKPAVATSR